MLLATFGAGCFWKPEYLFKKLEGVIETEVGYMGGNILNPTYQQVCTDQTGHAEVVQITYDESILNYDELLEVFWKIHDPTQLNRQGPDIGKQYRSVIFCHNEEQGLIAKQKIEKLEAAKTFSDPIVTSIEDATKFWKAEDYHQNYYSKIHGD
tara:strand:- start:70397 stop:70855 length:459 start_codon:yes stop_codon:yes gene_type:complete